MKLTVVFEHWQLGDGDYPAFAVGDEARLSFELNVLASEPAAPDAPDSVRQLRDAEHGVTAGVLRLYDDGLNSPFPVFEAAWLRFCSPSQSETGLEKGRRVRLRGTFALDHYLWVEFLDRYPDPPDLFYNVRVARVRRVAIPERFVQRDGRSMSHPTPIAPGSYEAGDVQEARAVEETGAGPEFSLLDLELLSAGDGPERPTFYGA